MSQTKYDIEYFITKYESTAEEEWCSGQLRNGAGQMCALGHCGVTTQDLGIYMGQYVFTEEGLALVEIFGSADEVWKCNDGMGSPRQHILDALYRFKELSLQG